MLSHVLPSFVCSVSCVVLQWCVSDIADHGGVYSYRLCQEDSIVARFIDPAVTPDQSDMTALEDCFQVTSPPGQS